MDAKTYLKVSGINLLFLFLGVLLGPAIVSSSRVLFTGVRAQEPPTLPTSNSPKSNSVQGKSEDANVDYVTPSLTTGTAAFNTLVAGRIACDNIQANGFDVLKLYDATLSMLYRKGLIKQSEIDGIVEAGKVDRPLRIKPRQ